MISRGVTCAADNLATSVLQHKHPRELLDSVVKERLVKSFSSQPRRAFYSVLCICQAVIFRSFQSFLCNFNHLRFRSLVSGRRILQRCPLLSTPLFLRFRPRRSNRQSSDNTLPDQLLLGFDEPKQLAVENCITLCLPRSFPFRLRRKWGEL